ncbi:Putative winged helix-like DNA-binding domain superfamily [Septoria linicola]|uniref:Winged helix-like DNA-binding domain superfamily n=1 Tax=Septoria linicola TaxID=215465 RepID=A0A9Q9AVL8_9PEZI|nr:putative winged helix-like DNA-binding domain superfamily [Septoria linicola]USW55970.1 Putative winged helix-like DNA-binding domain superfamily [Septoria linicola]
MAELTDLADRINSVAAKPDLDREATRSDRRRRGIPLVPLREPLDMGIFESLAATESPLSAAGLAKPVGVDPQLVLRIARSLVGTGFLADGQTVDGQNGFVITKIGRQAIVPSEEAGLKYHFDRQMEVVRHAPSFFRGNGHQTPKTQSEGLFQYMYSTEDDCYTYLSKQPGVMENFNTFMQGYFGSREMIMPLLWFPYDEVCLSGFDPNRDSGYVYVDVGGGKGHHVQELVGKYPDVRSHLCSEQYSSQLERQPLSTPDRNMRQLSGLCPGISHVLTG